MRIGAVECLNASACLSLLGGYLVFPHFQHSFNLAILNIGAPACGINAAVRSIIRYGLCEGHKMFAIFDGFEGLLNNQVRAHLQERPSTNRHAR